MNGTPERQVAPLECGGSLPPSLLPLCHKPGPHRKAVWRVATKAGRQAASAGRPLPQSPNQA